MSLWLTCVIPTIGRASLVKTLDSLDAQEGADGLEVLVVADIFGGLTHDLIQAREHVLFERDHARYAWLEYDGGLHCYGQPQRIAGAQAAEAPWVWFSQDDNVATPDALVRIRAAVLEQAHPRPLFFRMRTFFGAIVWSTQHLQLGNIDADCLVLPRHLARMVRWGMRYEGDFDAAVHASELAGGDVGWIDDLVSIGRPSDADCWWKKAA